MLLRAATRRAGVRGFQSRTEHSEWIRRVLRSRKIPPASMVEATIADMAPFLASVDPFAPQVRLRHAAPGSVPAGSSSASMLEATWPLSSSPMLQDAVSDGREGGLAGWSAMRLGKFYEALDALTGDVAHHHCAAGLSGHALVTGGHYHSVKLGRALPGIDITLRCYVTRTGSASLEVRTDAVQLNPTTGAEKLVNVCHTMMVATDPATSKPVQGDIYTARLLA